MNASATTGTGETLIRRADREDLEDLVLLEQNCFRTDRMSRRSLQRLILRPACILTAWKDGKLAGSLVLLTRKNSRIARIYSVCVDRIFQGQGIASQLICKAEYEAAQKNCRQIRLEIREDNPGSMKMFGTLGYRPYGKTSQYYEDGMTAILYRKSLPVSCNG